jgi:bacteriocin-like protein
MSDQKKAEVPEEIKKKQLDPEELTEEQLRHVTGGFNPIDGNK